jgi:plastocyanin
MQLRALFPIIALTAGLTASERPPVRPAAAAGRVVVVKMLDDRYEPEVIDVRRGDVIRFVQLGSRAHNVEFRLRGAPPGFDFGPNRRGPYFRKNGEVYEVAIDDRFVAGAYPFICTPHVMTGMKGVIRVGS